jgi:MoaA/NifB/PqqE/SkfB family radical SAM enzyme
MSWLDRLKRPRARPLRALQVEVTSRCTRRCVVCPRTSLEAAWEEGDLTAAAWRRLVPDLRLTEHVHLQGWGEPLLHPALPEWTRRARAAGCTVGLTTNGDLLDGASGWLLRGDVDRVVVSLAGGDRRHAALRDGSDLASALAAGGRLARAARERGRDLRVSGSYLLTRRNAPDLPAVVRRAADAGLDELFVIHLDCRTSPWQTDHSAFARGGLAAGVAEHLDAAERAAGDCGLSYRGPPREGAEPIACALDPGRFAFVGRDGSVAPCVNLLLPGAATIPRWTGEGLRRVAPVVYGNLAAATLAQLLASPERERFVAPFRARRAAEARFVTGMTARSAESRSLRRLEEADRARADAFAAHPFPAPCAGCPKARGW